MNPKRKILAAVLGIIGLLCVTLDAMGILPKLKLFFNITEGICYTCFLLFCLEKKTKTSD
jgi:hypothetical protein